MTTKTAVSSQRVTVSSVKTTKSQQIFEISAAKAARIAATKKAVTRIVATQVASTSRVQVA